MWLTTPLEAKPVNLTSTTDYHMEYNEIIGLVLSSVKFISVNFLNEIRYFLIK